MEKFKKGDKVKFMDGRIVEVLKCEGEAWAHAGVSTYEYLVKFEEGGKEKIVMEWEISQLSYKDRIKCECGADSLTNRNIRDASHALWCPKYKGMK